MNCKIEQDGDGLWHAQTSGLDMVVDKGGRSFMRVGIKNAGSKESYEVRWLVGELDGVRLYAARSAAGLSLILTRRDLSP